MHPDGSQSFCEALMAQEIPNRMVYLEELDKSQLDVSSLKEFADGKQINRNIMYGT